jgi:hypothetical protein
MGTDATPKPNLRWFHVTADRALIALLVVEFVLWLSERFQWFEFNQHKGCTVLIAVAVVCLALVAALLWLGVAWLFRFPFQFGVRTLFGLTLTIALPLSWLSSEMKNAEKQRELVENYEKSGGVLGSDLWDWNKGFPLTPQTPAPEWLQKLLGLDFFGHITEACRHPYGRTDARFQRGISDEELAQLSEYPHLQVLSLESFHCVTDAGLENIRMLVRLRKVDLRGTQVTDAGLEHLKGLRQLAELDLRDTSVTDEGAKRLQQALPNCRIELGRRGFQEDRN